MPKKLLSIIVPVYNVEKYIDKCIQSVLYQTYSNWELILINDGSPDNSPKICENYAEQDYRIKVIHKENGGVASARNMGIEIATGDYITFLDSDDYLHPEFINHLLNLAISNNADIVQCGFLKGIDKEFPILDSKEKINSVDNYDIFLKGFAKIIVWGKIYKKYVIEGLPIPENKLFEDDFITWRWYFNAKKIIVTTRLLYYYTDNNESTMSNYIKKPRLDFMDAYNERINFFKRINEKSMEDYSRIHFCKALLLTYNNNKLTKDQKILIINNFMKNWMQIKDSKVLKTSLKLLFNIFVLFPSQTTRIVNRIR